MSAPMIRFGSFELDPDAQELRRSGTLVHLTGKPVLLLLYLIEYRGKVVSREELKRALWNDGTHVDFEHGLNNAMNKVRFALGDSSTVPRYVETLPRRGYRFVAPVDIVDAKKSQRSWRGVAAAALIVVIAACAVVLTRDGATSRAAAHEAYLKGREELAAGTPESVARARVYFERAIQLDGESAAAYCGLAVALNRAGMFGLAEPRQAIAVANMALRLDPELAEAYVARATARVRLQWDWRGAEADVRDAIRLDPNFVQPHQTYAQLLDAQGRTREALREIATARQLDPLSDSLRRDEALILYHSRQFDAAIRQLELLVANKPADAVARRTLADAYFHAGHSEAASREYLRWLELVGVSDTELDRARARLSGGGFNALWSYLAASTVRKGHAYKMATVLAGLGRRDEALAALEEAFRNRESQLFYVKADPYLDALRGDARFASLLRRARL